LTIRSTITHLKHLLSQDETLAHVKIKESFTPDVISSPLKKIYVTISLNSATIEEIALSNYLGQTSNTSIISKFPQPAEPLSEKSFTKPRPKVLCSHLAKIKLDLGIYVPQNIEGHTSIDIFSKILDILIANKNHLNTRAISLNQIKHESSISAFILNGNINIETFL
jgi:hypothetical protein